jgi:antitoxin CcdA
MIIVQLYAFYRNSGKANNTTIKPKGIPSPVKTLFRISTAIEHPFPAYLQGSQRKVGTSVRFGASRNLERCQEVQRVLFALEVDLFDVCTIMRILMRTLIKVHTLCAGDLMQSLYDQNAPKKPTNLSINSDLLAKARALNINLSATLEEALGKELAQVEGAKWAEENKTAITAYNAFVEEHGCFGDEFREF